jgi:tetratricopeptide (TPR) repeat protein
VALKTLNPKVYYNYGLLLNGNKKGNEAESVLQKGISVSPNSPDLYYALSFVYIQMNNIPKAKQAATTLKRLDPSNQEYQQLFQSLGVN